MSVSGVTDPTEAYFKDGIWGHDGTQWRKLPLVWGYSELAGENLSDTNLDAGTNTLDGTAVSAGEIVIVHQVTIMYEGTAPGALHCLPVGTPGTPMVLSEHSPADSTYYNEKCFVILEQGDYMQALVLGATAGDNLYFWYSGYKMKIAE